MFDMGGEEQTTAWGTLCLSSSETMDTAFHWLGLVGGGIIGWAPSVAVGLGLALASWMLLGHKIEQRRLLRCSFTEVLKNYQPGKILDLHHRFACLSHPKCWDVWVPGDPLIYGTVSPEIVDYVLVRNFANWEKGSQWRTAFRDLLGDGIFNADGATWKKQRKVASHEFSMRSLRDFMFEVFRLHAETVLTLVGAATGGAGTAQDIDMQALFARYTLESIGQIGFGCSLGALEDDGTMSASFGDAFNTATQRSGDRFIDPLWKIKRFLRIGSERELWSALKRVRAFSEGVIRERREESRSDPQILAGRQDLLSRFMRHGPPEPGAGKGSKVKSKEQEFEFTDEELHYTVINFVLAGRDTTANLLSWTLFRLSRHPEIVERIREEARNKALTYDSLGGRHFLRAVLTETLRLHPSVPLDFKAAVKADVLPDGTRIKAGQRVMFVAWSMGRQPHLWPNPDVYNPDRFLTDEGKFRFPSPSLFPAFLAGPRTCKS